MDFVNIVKSLEELFYEFMFWLMMFPKTLIQTIWKPGQMVRYISEEWNKEAQDRYKNSITPFIFWLISSALFISSFDSAAGTSLITGQSMLLVFAMILAFPPIVFTLVMLRAKATTIEYGNFRRPFHIQLTVFGVFQTMAAIFLFMTNYAVSDEATTIFFLFYLLLFVAIPVWLFFAETVVMQEEIGSKWLTAAGWTLAGVAALVIGTIFLIPVMEPLINIVITLIPQ